MYPIGQVGNLRMKVSQKAEYAFRAMLELSQRLDQTQAVRTADIARRQRIPGKFLELILVELRRAGLIISQRGPIGGHRLAKPAGKITVGAIWRAVDSSMTGSPARGRGADAFQVLCGQVNRSISAVIDTVTLEDMRASSKAREKVPDFNI